MAKTGGAVSSGLSPRLNRVLVASGPSKTGSKTLHQLLRHFKRRDGSHVGLNYTNLFRFHGPKKNQHDNSQQKGRRPLFFLFFPSLTSFSNLLGRARALVVKCTLSFCLIFCFVTTVRSENAQEGLINAYLEAAFPMGQEKLRKFSNENPFGYGLVCSSTSVQKCRDLLEFFRQSVVSNPSMMLEQRDSGRVEFIIADQDKMLEHSTRLSKKFAGGIIDREDKDCQLYLNVNDARIDQATVLISLESL
jgi:hypothetical protein